MYGNQQSIDNVKGRSPISLANDLRTRFLTRCARQTIRGPERFNMDGYPAVRLYVECDEPTFEKKLGGRELLRHEVMAFQIIQGQSNLYVVERAWHGRSQSAPKAPYGRDDLWGWDGFWHNIEVCNSKDRVRACFGLGLLSPEEASIYASQTDPVLPYGCDYFRILSLLPDTTRATRSTLVVPLKLGLGSFGGSKTEQRLISNLVAAYEKNVPVAVIVTMAPRALSQIFSTDAAKAGRDTNNIASFLVAGGVAPDRIYQTLNADCPGG